jgi:hypothetical protein
VDESTQEGENQRQEYNKQRQLRLRQQRDRLLGKQQRPVLVNHNVVYDRGNVERVSRFAEKHFHRMNSAPAQGHSFLTSYFTGPLIKSQLDAIVWLKDQKNKHYPALIADEPGMGKTGTVITICIH